MGTETWQGWARVGGAVLGVLWSTACWGPPAPFARQAGAERPGDGSAADNKVDTPGDGDVDDAQGVVQPSPGVDEGEAGNGGDEGDGEPGAEQPSPAVVSVFPPAGGLLAADETIIVTLNGDPPADLELSGSFAAHGTIAIVGVTQLHIAPLDKWPEGDATAGVIPLQGANWEFHVRGRVLFVAPGGEGDGSRDAPMGSLYEAIAVGPHSGTRGLAIADGKYKIGLGEQGTGPIPIGGVALYGGYIEDFSARGEHGWLTAIDGSGSLNDEDVFAPVACAGPGALMDGVSVNAGAAQHAAAVRATTGCALTIRHSEMLASTGFESNSGLLLEAGIVRVEDSLIDADGRAVAVDGGTAQVSRTWISTPPGSTDAAVQVAGTGALILDHSVVVGSGTYGVHDLSGSQVVLYNNTIICVEDTGCLPFSAVGTSVTAINNLFSGGTSALYLYQGEVTFLNNGLDGTAVVNLELLSSAQAMEGKIRGDGGSASGNLMASIAWADIGGDDGDPSTPEDGDWSLHPGAHCALREGGRATDAAGHALSPGPDILGATRVAKATCGAGNAGASGWSMGAVR